MRAGEPLLPRSTSSRATDVGSTGGLIGIDPAHQHSCHRSSGAGVAPPDANAGRLGTFENKPRPAHASAFVAPRYIAEHLATTAPRSHHSIGFSRHRRGSALNAKRR